MPGEAEEDAVRGKARSARFYLTAGLVAAVAIFFFVALPCTIYEMGSRSATGLDIAMAHQLYIAAYNYHSDRGSYPASLDSPDFQPYIEKGVAEFIGQGHVTYYRPEPDSPKNFRFLKVSTPRGEFFYQLDGTTGAEFRPGPKYGIRMGPSCFSRLRWILQGDRTVAVPVPE